METDLSVFVAKTHRGYVGYVRIHKGRVLRYTETFPNRDMAQIEAEKIKSILEAHPMWWEQ